MGTSDSDRTTISNLEATPSETVIDAVASLTDDDPLEMEPLGAVIDPDALDGLFRQNGRGDGAPEVAFDFHGCRVHVRGDGSVLARKTTD